MISIAHAALWVKDLEAMKAFYETHFGAKSGPRYENPAKGFSSYFLSFGAGARLELMNRIDMPYPSPTGFDPSGLVIPEHAGFAHLAFSVGSEAAVDEMTERLSGLEIAVVSGPRRTGDGYYESVIADPEGNLIEITA